MYAIMLGFRKIHETRNYYGAMQVADREARITGIDAGVLNADGAIIYTARAGANLHDEPGHASCPGGFLA